MKKGGANILKTLDALTDALGRSEDQSVDEVKADLIEEGFDIDKIIIRLNSSKNNIIMESKRNFLDEVKERRIQAETKQGGIFKKFTEWSREQLEETLREWGGSDVSLAYRDLTSIDREELISILEDMEIARQASSEEDEEIE